MSCNYASEIISGKFLRAEIKSFQMDVDEGWNNFISHVATAAKSDGAAPVQFLLNPGWTISGFGKGKLNCAMYLCLMLVMLCCFQLKNMQQKLAMMQAEMEQKAAAAAAAASSPSKLPAELASPPASKPPPPPVAARKPSFEGKFNNCLAIFSWRAKVQFLTSILVIRKISVVHLFTPHLILLFKDKLVFSTEVGKEGTFCIALLTVNKVVKPFVPFKQAYNGANC